MELLPNISYSHSYDPVTHERIEHQEIWRYEAEDATIADMVGRTMASAVAAKDEDDGRGYGLIFTTDDGIIFEFSHHQSCCEDVYIEDICGDLSDLVGSPIVMAEEVSSEGAPEPPPPENSNNDSHTWTFYKFATIKGSVTVRWLGRSTGYYSEGVDLDVYKPA